MRELILKTNAEENRRAYIRKLFSPGFNDSITFDFPSDKRQLIQLSPEEGQILNTIVKMVNPKKIVELGTLFGYSAACIADALPEDSILYTIEKNEEHASIAQRNLRKIGKNVKVVSGEALTVLNNIEIYKPFDMIFIDAKKSEYCKYIDWAEVNLRKGGIIIADNVLLFGRAYLPESQDNSNQCNAMREFNRRLSDKEKYSSCFIPTTEGMIISIKEF